MALFCTSIRSDSVSLVKFPFLSQVKVFKILFVYRLKCPYNCFSSHFCFLVLFILVLHVSSLVAAINPSLLFFMSSSSRLIDVLTLSSMLTRKRKKKYICWIEQPLTLASAH